MKYMGSKRFMLGNGLGQLIRELGAEARFTRFVDLFTGSGAVAAFATTVTPLSALAVDLQEYARVLAAAVVERDAPINPEMFEAAWLEPALARLRRHPLRALAEQHSRVAEGPGLESQVDAARALCEQPTKIGPMWGAYGGYYYSPLQALTFDYLRRDLPVEEPLRTVALAALIMTASRCAAAPGHTAQPFKPNDTAGKYIVESWSRDVTLVVRDILAELAPRHARVAGHTRRADALEVLSDLGPTDLVFVDPPYSAVQYSRFYHVLETLANGHCGPVSGIGRYPAREHRPQSDFSLISNAQPALTGLLEGLAKTGATVIFTFPRDKCSNGLSGELVRELAETWFSVQVKTKVHGSFSTLGGKQGGSRRARQDSIEYIMLLTPKVTEKIKSGALQQKVIHL